MKSDRGNKNIKNMLQIEEFSRSFVTWKKYTKYIQTFTLFIIIHYIHFNIFILLYMIEMDETQKKIKYFIENCIKKCEIVDKKI